MQYFSMEDRGCSDRSVKGDMSSQTPALWSYKAIGQIVGFPYNSSWLLVFSTSVQGRVFMTCTGLFLRLLKRLSGGPYAGWPLISATEPMKRPCPQNRWRRSSWKTNLIPVCKNTDSYTHTYLQPIIQTHATSDHTPQHCLKATSSRILKYA